MKLETKLVNGFFGTVCSIFLWSNYLMLKRKTELFFQWELLLGSFNIIIALKHRFMIDLGPENVPPSLLCVREVTNYILYPVVLVSPSLAEGFCDISQFGFSVCNMSVLCDVLLCVHQ